MELTGPALPDVEEERISHTAVNSKAAAYMSDLTYRIGGAPNREKDQVEY